jgi:hypothetical protein
VSSDTTDCQIDKSSNEDARESPPTCPFDGTPDLERNEAVGKSKKRYRSSKQGNADAWARWQLLATVIRIGIELLDRFLGGGPRCFP